MRTFVESRRANAPAIRQAVQELKGDIVELRETSSRSCRRRTSRRRTNSSTTSARSDFTAVYAYHHCDWLFRLLEGMGIDVPSYFDGTQFPVPVDHYALGIQVNAQAPGNAMGNGSGGFLFGLARAGQPIGIATTARVVLHEFGHALFGITSTARISDLPTAPATAWR